MTPATTISQQRREREREEIRERILAAARDLFAKRGYAAVTMREIARRIEYTTTALYFHFRDKETLFRALCATDFLALAQRFQSIARIADPVERIRETGRAYIRFGLEHPNQYRFMFMTPHPPIDPAMNPLEKGNPEQDAYAFLRGAVAEAIAAGRFRPELSDPDLAAQLLWSGVHGLVGLRITHEGWVEWRDLDTSVERMLDALYRGVLRAEG